MVSDDADDLDLLTALMDDDEAFEEESCAVLEESTPPSSDDNPDQSSPSAKKHDVSIDEMSGENGVVFPDPSKAESTSTGFPS